MLPLVQVKYNYQDLQTVPDDRNHYELFGGALIMTPAPSRDHQRAVRNLTLLLGNYLKKFRVGELYVAPFDIYFDDETVVEPDLFVVLNARLALIDERKMNGAPDLVIEILSPSTEERDRGFKFKRYAQEGVSEYWLVDPINRKIEVYSLTEKGFALFGGYSAAETVRSKLFAELHFPSDEVWE